ncbi:MAG TPA: Rrf2 family transcriptional regulator [Bdellovibrionota bacterium]|jgi:Rrf2 family protein|nr:Rrf2 family transcriptional regulator [Bdellovibrionota bacterium]
MHVSSLQEYGLRCALQLARRYGAGQVPASWIAQEEGVSTEYVSKVMFLFRKAGLIQASRGSQGGFGLSREPGQITLKQVMDAVGSDSGRAEEEFCQHFKGKQDACVHFGGCSVRPVWTMISGYFDAVMRELTLQDLLAREQDVAERVGRTAERKSRELREAIVKTKERV